MAGTARVRSLTLVLTLLLIAAPLLFALPPGAGFAWMAFAGGSPTGAGLMAAATLAGLLTLYAAPRVLGALGLMVFSLFAAVGLAARFGPAFPDHVFAVVYIAAPLLFLVLAAVLGRRIEAFGWFRAGVLSGRMKVALTILVMLCMGVLAAYFSGLKPDLTHQPLIRSIKAPALLLITGLAIAALNSLIEEAIYRGILYDAIERAGFGAWIAVAIQAVAFGTFHLNSNEPGLVGVAMTAVLGLVLGILRRVSGGLIAPYILHFALDIGVYSLGAAQVLGWAN